MLKKIQPEDNIDIILWFDLNIDNFENTTYQNFLKAEYKLKTFSNLDIFKSYVSNNLKSKALLIVTATSCQDVFKECYSSNQICKILIFTSKKLDEVSSQLENSYEKVYKIVNSFRTLQNCLNEIFKKKVNNSEPIESKWAWTNDLGSFINYDSKTSKAIEAFYQLFLIDSSLNLKSEITVTKFDTKKYEKYIIDFVKMVQINKLTGFKRKINRNTN